MSLKPQKSPKSAVGTPKNNRMKQFQKLQYISKGHVKRKMSDSLYQVRLQGIDWDCMDGSWGDAHESLGNRWTSMPFKINHPAHNWPHSSIFAFLGDEHKETAQSSLKGNVFQGSVKNTYLKVRDDKDDEGCQAEKDTVIKQRPQCMACHCTALNPRRSPAGTEWYCQSKQSKKCRL